MKIVKIISDNVDIDYRGETSRPGCLCLLAAIIIFWALVIIMI